MIDGRRRLYHPGIWMIFQQKKLFHRLIIRRGTQARARAQHERFHPSSAAWLSRQLRCWTARRGFGSVPSLSLPVFPLSPLPSLPPPPPGSPQAARCTDGAARARGLCSGPSGADTVWRPRMSGFRLRSQGGARANPKAGPAGATQM